MTISGTFRMKESTVCDSFACVDIALCENSWNWVKRRKK